MTEVVIAGAARTPVGSFNGSLASVPASYLGTVAIKEAMQRAKVDAQEVDEAILNRELESGYGIFSGAATRQAVLRFGPQLARWVSRETWHPDQTGEYDDDRDGRDATCFVACGPGGHPGG